MQVDVSPDMGMYHLLRSQGYDPAYAIAEFVDNAVQAHLSHASASAEPLSVDIRFYSNDHRDPKTRNSIVIEDDGPGITRDRLGDAMKPAKPSLNKGLSEFGIGMKAAAVWFSDKWVLKTTPAHSKNCYELTFDLPTLLESGRSKVEVDASAASSGQGTTLSLTQLRRSVDAGKFQHICGELRELYQRFTAGASPILKLTAHHNDTPVDLQYPPTDRAVLQAPVYRTVGQKVYAVGTSRAWTVPVDITFEGASVQGFICLLERGSYTTNPGLVMFRNDRVIKGTLTRPNLPIALFKTSNKYARQRVYGELFVDPQMPVTYTKDGFEIDEGALADELAKVPGVVDLLRQAEDYRVKGEIISVATESDIPNLKSSKGRPAVKGVSPNASVSTAAPINGNAPVPSAPAASPAGASSMPQKPAPTIPPFTKLLDDLKPQTNSVALSTMMDEAKYQYQWRRPISAAMCMRTVVELATMDRVRRDFPNEYPKVAEKAIKSLLNYMNSNASTFFDQKADYNVIKCVQSLATGTQADVVLLNNVSHGHYQPSLSELNTFANNIEALLRWAYK